jgi:hypothetical protein
MDSDDFHDDPIFIRKGRMETGDQFFSRLAARRGIHLFYDEALLWGRDALESKRLSLVAAALVESDRARVIAASRDDPLGVKPPTLEVIEACMQLVKVGVVARFAPEAEIEFRARITPEIEVATRKRGTEVATDTRQKEREHRRQKIQAICEAKGWQLGVRNLTQWVAREIQYEVSDDTIERDLKAIFRTTTLRGNRK